MNKLALIVAASTLAGMSGCMSTSPHWDAHFGYATRMAAIQQTIDPNASANPDPVAGIDGKAAHGALGEYGKSFTRPEPTPQFFTIGVGGESGR